MAVNKSVAKKATASVVVPTKLDAFLVWFAASPFGTAARVGVGAAAAWAIDNVTSFSQDPVVTALIIAIVSTVLRGLNPQDKAYGKTE
jgi:hypothetical protein